jgi:hypothetical protein
MQAQDKECKQCGWEISKNAAPVTDPADTRARMFVSLGLVVAYWVMWSMVAGADVAALAAPAQVSRPAAPNAADIYESVDVQPQATPVAIAIGTTTADPAVTGALVATGKEKLLAIKVAEVKSASIPGRDALHYEFVLPETDQRCNLVGQVKGISGFSRDVEVFLLTDDEYLFWHANPIGVAHSSWETVRGSEATLDYSLSSAGTYHLIVSNEMSPSPYSVHVKANVKCVR